MRQLFIFTLVLANTISCAQQKASISSAIVQQLENLVERDDSPIEDDSFLQQLEFYAKHPINLNVANEEELSGLNLLSGLQVQNLLMYRHLFGKLVSIYELQAVPTWDLNTIEKVLPYISVMDDAGLVENLKHRLSGGDQSMLVRSAQVLEKSKGFQREQSPGNYYTGSANELYVRYKYNYKNLLQWGLVGDKDAGEQFFRGKQTLGFDFYSFHFFARKIGIIKSLAVGDFTVNMGQGLIQWQSLGFNRGADLSGIKRQSPVLSPYNSSGEFNFHRGIGITLQKKRWEGTVFISARKLSGNLVADQAGEEHITSLLASGYHRTAGELADRNNTSQVTEGANLSFKAGNWHIGANLVHYNFSLPLLKQDLPYNLYAAKGSSFTNLSLDYSYTYRNVHCFGEAAADKNGNKAFVNGLLISLDPKADLSILHRAISERYQSLYSNAFTQTTSPVNENGVYAGISFRPSALWTIGAYTDIFNFPWLKYRVDAPSWGKEYFIQLTYKPSKEVEVYTLFRSEVNPLTRPYPDQVTSRVDMVPKQNWRIQSNVALNRFIGLRNRCEVEWYDKNGPGKEQGFLMSGDFLYQARAAPLSGNIRLQYFDSQGFNSRLYAYENDVQYSFSIPSFFDEGLRYYVNFNWNASEFSKKHLSKSWKAEFCLRWAETIYTGKNIIGSGLDTIKGNKKSEIKIELLFHR